MTRPATTHDGSPTRRKATLFCWECDHSSPIDGDWVMQSRDQSVAYVCPDCETTLTERPRARKSARERALPAPLAMWHQTVRRAATIWRASVDVGLSQLTTLVGPLSIASSQYR